VYRKRVAPDIDSAEKAFNREGRQGDAKDAKKSK
jgi:hypothetical protein